MRSAPTFLTQDETRRLFAAITDKRDRALFLTTYRHGLRACELGRLHRADLDLSRARLTIHRAKHSLDGIHPLQPDELKTLRAYLKARTDDLPYLFLTNRYTPIDRRTVWHLMQQYGKAADLPTEKRHPHVLKHSIATHLLDAGADIRFVQDWLGHANIQNTTIYARLTSTTRDEQARKLFTSPRVV